MTTLDYRESHLQAGKGKTYHERFEKSPYRKLMWEQEQKVLNSLVREFLPRGGIRHLDFACGTGRVLTFLGGHVGESTGVDVSSSMLEVAREHSPHAEILEADITRNDVLGDREFDLITAFRFLPNAQPELRSQVMRVLRRHLAPGGCLVFNNHKNTGSIRNRMARMIGRRDYQGMSDAEARTLVAEAGLTIARVYHLGTFPASEKHPVLPIALLRPLDVWLSNRTWLCPLGGNLIYACGG